MDLLSLNLLDHAGSNSIKVAKIGLPAHNPFDQHLSICASQEKLNSTLLICICITQYFNFVEWKQMNRVRLSYDKFHGKFKEITNNRLSINCHGTNINYCQQIWIFENCLVCGIGSYHMAHMLHNKIPKRYQHNNILSNNIYFYLTLFKHLRIFPH